MLVILVCISLRDFCHLFTFIFDDYHSKYSFVFDRLNWSDPHKFLGFVEVSPY